jgi:antitoxin (DNA-binding transcriptional repressor) of toxin-antitoxin stability system
MTVTATDLRKNLFTLLERVLRGETVEVRYKRSTVRIAPTSSGSKLARAKRQPTLLCDPDAIVRGGWRKR